VVAFFRYPGDSLKRVPLKIGHRRPDGLDAIFPAAGIGAGAQGHALAVTHPMLQRTGHTDNPGALVSTPTPREPVARQGGANGCHDIRKLSVLIRGAASAFVFVAHMPRLQNLDRLSFERGKSLIKSL